MAFIDQFDLSNDPFMRAKVTMAMAAAAVAIGGESRAGVTDPKYSKRQTLAKAVLTQPSGWIEQFALAVFQNPAVTAGPAVNISSSTNAFPIVVTTAAAHGLATGDTVRIAGHLVNLAAVGTWTVTVLTGTTFSIPVAGVGVGAATGRIVKLPSDSDVQFTVNAVWDDMAGVTVLD